jgi:hypothetical protein
LLPFAESSNKFVIPFIITTTFVALDFWITKNVTGRYQLFTFSFVSSLIYRLLVGLRWWNEIKEDGSSVCWRLVCSHLCYSNFKVWIFESLEKEALINALDQQIFWIALFVFNLVWLIMFLYNVFNPLTYVPLASVVVDCSSFSRVDGTGLFCARCVWLSALRTSVATSNLQRKPDAKYLKRSLLML